MTNVTVWHCPVRVYAVHVKCHRPLSKCKKWEVGNGEPCVRFCKAERPTRGLFVTSAQQWIWLAMNAKDATTNQAAWLWGLFYEGVLDIYVYILEIPHIIIHLVIAVLIGPLCIPILWCLSQMPQNQYSRELSLFRTKVDNCIIILLKKLLSLKKACSNFMQSNQ